MAKMLVDRIKANFNARTLYKGRNTTYDTILQDNVQQLAKYIQDKLKQLTFNIPIMQNYRNDDAEVRDYLLNITPEERRKLGINRNTLWYIKMNIREGKKIELYDKVKAQMV